MQKLAWGGVGCLHRLSFKLSTGTSSCECLKKRMSHATLVGNRRENRLDATRLHQVKSQYQRRNFHNLSSQTQGEAAQGGWGSPSSATQPNPRRSWAAQSNIRNGRSLRITCSFWQSRIHSYKVLFEQSPGHANTVSQIREQIDPSPKGNSATCWGRCQD